MGHHEAACELQRLAHATFCICAAKNKYSQAPQTVRGADLGLLNVQMRGRLGIHIR